MILHRYISRYTACIFIIFGLVFMCGVSLRAATPTASGILDKAASALLKGGGVSASYTIKSGGGTQQGTLNVKGKKFNISSRAASTWYNGRTLWDYNAANNEVTLSAPTAQEVSAINPYALVASYKTAYTPKLLKSSIRGTYAVLLAPKSTQSAVKSAIVYIRASDYQPVRLDVTARNGSVSTIVVTNIRRGVKLADAVFNFPKNKYPNASIVDLR